MLASLARLASFKACELAEQASPLQIHTTEVASLGSKLAIKLIHPLTQCSESKGSLATLQG